MKRVIVLAALAAIAWSVVAHPWGWLYGLGVHPYPGPQTPWTYQMWSGIVPAMTVTTVLAAVVTGYRRVNCHVHGCWRIGRYEVADGHFKVCRKHHPDDPVRLGRATAAHIKAVHNAHLRTRDGAGRAHR